MEVPRGYWARKLERPIFLKAGTKLATLVDARTLILSLPESSQQTLYWQYAFAGGRFPGPAKKIGRNASASLTRLEE
jgi:hypothetical protein